MPSEFARSRPGLRLYVRCEKSDRMRRALERGEIDLALFKRDAEESGGIAAWPERLHWITSRHRPVDFRRDPLAACRIRAGMPLPQPGDPRP
jgi:DNA-binding transcriptional LysR family regulator